MDSHAYCITQSTLGGRYYVYLHASGLAVSGRGDGSLFPLVRGTPYFIIDIAGDWAAFLAGGLGAAECDALRHHDHTGRPLGDGSFIERLETTLARSLKKKKPGLKRTRGGSE